MGFTTDTQRWAQGLFGHAHLGDPRRNRRLITYVTDQAQQAQHATAKVCPGAARRLAAYRLLHNRHVDPEAISEGAFAHTIRQLAQSQRVLAVEDSTSLSYRHTVRHQLGLIGNDRHGRRRGFHVHSVLLVEAGRGFVYGLADQQWWMRDPGSYGKRHRRRKRAYRDKESALWERSSRRVRARLEGEQVKAEVISVCDRGADIYEYLQYKQEQGEPFIVRSNQNRLLVGGLRLGAHMKQVAPFEESLTLQVEGRRQPARLALRVATVVLAPTSRRGQPREPALRPLSVQVVEVTELDAPAGEPPLHWRLYTSLPVETLEQALEILRLYRLRWRIEEWHKAWKSDCGVEVRQIRRRDALQRLAIILGWIAIRMIQLQQLEEASEEAPCTSVLTREEMHCLWAATETAPFPPEEPTVAWAKRAIARLGNFYDSHRTGRPGRRTMQDGLIRLTAICLGWRLARQQIDDL